MSHCSMKPEELGRLCRDGRNVTLIDVRTPVEFRELHVVGARNIPLDRLDPAEFLQIQKSSDAGPLLVICGSGSRGQKACELLQKGGVADVRNVEGGTLACVDAGLPVVRGRKAMSLERQVRIAAGSLVLLGIAGSWLHPALLGLSAFVGAGLIFSGLTDTCGMGMILARMPWNQVSSNEHACAH